MTRVRLAVAAALVLATAGVVPAASAGCAAVRRAAGWALTDAPVTTVAAAGTTVGEADQTTHSFAWADQLVAAGGVPGRWFASDGVSVFRSADSGCTWQRVYSVEPTLLSASAADAVGVVPTAVVTYRIVAVAVPLVAPGARGASGTDLVYALVAFGQGPGWQPQFVARSADGGRTWRTDVLAAPLPGASVATPVLADGEFDAALAVSPADPRTAYVTVSWNLDPRAQSAERWDVAGIYVTRDGGATWSFAAAKPGNTPIVPDVRDPLTFYAAEDGVLDAVTVGAAPARRRLLTLPDAELVVAIDTVRDPGRPARLLVTTAGYNADSATVTTRLHRSADGGRTWSATVVPGSGVIGMYAFCAWLTRTGEVVALWSVGGYPDAALTTQRWTARNHWQPRRRPRVPHATWATNALLTGAYAADTEHRSLAVLALDQAQGRIPREVVGIADLRSL